VSEPRGIYDFTPPPPLGKAWTDFMDPAADTYRRKLDLDEFQEQRFYRPIRRAPRFQMLRDLAGAFLYGAVLISGALFGLWAWASAGLPFYFRVEVLQ